MKKYSILLLLSFVLLSLGCKDDNNSTKPDDNGGKNNPLTSQGLVCEIDGKEFKFETCYVMSNTPVADYLTIASPDATGLQLRTIPNAKGTYKHNDGDNEYRRYNVWFNFEGKRYDVNNSLGSSTVTLTEVGVMPATGAYYDGFIKGSFSGTFVAEDNSQIVITNGFFYAEGYPQF